MMSISCGIQAGFTLNFPEEPETAQENIREIGPHVMFAPLVFMNRWCGMSRSNIWMQRGPRGKPMSGP